MRIRNSFWAMLGQDISSEPDTVARVRQAMLSLMAEYCPDNAELRHKLTFASDIDALWYLRSNLMIELSARHGELVARNLISRITFLFQERQPGGAMRNRA